MPNTNRTPTELILRDWRFGQTQAERLAAAVLHLERFVDVDPQCPLGGRDGLKDVLCARDGKSWVAAAYFPPTAQDFRAVRAKFGDDLIGVAKNQAEGFVFLTNQRLTPTERATLLADAEAKNASCEIYHVERLRGILDAPRGYGVRLEHLRVSMTEEEQISFFSELNYETTRQLLDNDRRLSSMDAKLDLVLKRTAILGEAILQGQSSITQRTTPEGSLEIENPTSLLSIANVCWIHRIVTENTSVPETSRGRLRSVSVEIRGDRPFSPCRPEQVPIALRDLVEWWRNRHPELTNRPKPEIIGELATLHHRFVQIHPFVDGNGRVARVLLDQAARELLNQRVGPNFLSDPQTYYATLEAADRGEIQPLARLIMASLE